MFDVGSIAMPADAVAAEAGGIAFVDAASRPSVRDFFEAHGTDCCLLHGFEVRSVTHERCRQLILTGHGDAAADDWPSILAGNSNTARVLPHLVISGPAYTARYGSQVVRIGDRAQLPELLDGSALLSSDQGLAPLPTTASQAADAFLAQRIAALAPEGSAQDARWAAAHAEVLSQKTRLADHLETLQFEVLMSGCERDLATDFGTAFDAMELGLTRTAMVQYNGWCSEGWDTHQGIELQDLNFEGLFAYLLAMKADLATRIATSGLALADELTIVVFSEMGRHPQLNTWGGKDHWTFTSALLMGSGIAGGQVVGGYDAEFLGHPIDLGSGEPTTAGTALTSGHLGATLLALGGVDPEEALPGVPVIDAVLA
jgi:uncharacterized protein (DUF1501 family)